jgi:glycosyltransferase involved in cell wall biosynthesis
LDVNDLADKILQVLVNKDLQNQLIKAGREHIKQFSAEEGAKSLIGIYKNLTGSQSLASGE